MNKIINVTAQRDHFSKISKASPDKALAELIWNGLDADAEKVEVIFRENDYGSTEVIIKDNGYGI